MTAPRAKWWLPDDVQFVDAIPHTEQGPRMSDQINEVIDRYLLEQAIRAYEQHASTPYCDKNFKAIFEAAKKHLETMPKPPKFAVTTIKDRSGETVQVKEFDTFLEARRHLTMSMENGCFSSKITRIQREHEK